MEQNIPTQQPPVAPQTPPVQQPPVIETMPKDKPPIFSIIAGVIVIVAIAGYIALASFYDLWPFSYTEPEMEATPTPAGSLYYDNKDYGFSFTYPRAGEVTDIDVGAINYKSPELVKDIKENPENYTGDIPGDAFVKVIDSESGSFNAIESEVSVVGTQFDDREERIENIFLDENIPAIKATVWSPSHPEWEWVGIFIERGSYFVVIENGANIERKEEFEDFYNSFDFYYENWKTYNSSTYGYRIVYPPEWTVAEFSPENVRISLVLPIVSSHLMIRYMTEGEFLAEAETLTDAKAITLESGQSAYRFERDLDIDVMVYTYIKFGEKNYFVMSHIKSKSESEQMVQSFKFN